jgi:hypothetical protein
MRKLFSRLLFSGMILGTGLSNSLTAKPPNRFTGGPERNAAGQYTPVGVGSTPHHDPAMNLSTMQPRSVTVQVNPGSPNVHKVNSRSLIINFELANLGPSGVGAVELWYTRNGQTWEKCPGGSQTESPFLQEVSEDGLYGFTVVATNGMGIGKALPVPGDVPQMWVDVDTTAPEVRLLSTQAGADENGRTLTLRWTASDRNLVARPIMLCYAEKAEGPWIPFAMNLENTGKYIWHMPPGLPSNVLVYVQAIDCVANISGDQASLPAPLDLTRPTATIQSVTRNGVLVPVKGQE